MTWRNWRLPKVTNGQQRAVVPVGTDLAAAAAAALVGMVSFGVYHTIWIRNVPAVFLEGLLYAIPATLGLAWMLRTTRSAGRSINRPTDGLAAGALCWLIFVPYEVVGLLLPPRPQPTSFAEALPLLWIAFLGVPVGVLIGWLLTRQPKPSLAWAVGALTVGFTVGGSLTFFGGRGRFLGLFLWLLPTCMLAGAAMAMTARLLGRRT